MNLSSAYAFSLERAKILLPAKEMQQFFFLYSNGLVNLSNSESCVKVFPQSSCYHSLI